MIDSSARTSSRQSRAAAVGASAGLVFGLLVVLFGFGPALFISLCTVVGGALGWLAYGAVSDRLEDAWDAFRQRGRSSPGRSGSR